MEPCRRDTVVTDHTGPVTLRTVPDPHRLHAAAEGNRSTACRGSRGTTGARASISATPRAPLIDHNEIRRWAEYWNARPARVQGTGGRDVPGTLRLDFPDDGPDPDVEPISWTDWFRSFDRNNLAFLYEERTDGRSSNFNRLVYRATVEDLVRDDADRLAPRADSHDVR
jgi:hypothetical protein